MESYILKIYSYISNITFIDYYILIYALQGGK